MAEMSQIVVNTMKSQSGVEHTVYGRFSWTVLE
jgi:hypothetical protein